MKLRPYMIFIGFFTPGVLVLIMLMVVKGGFQLLDLIITESYDLLKIQGLSLHIGGNFICQKNPFKIFSPL